MVTRRRIVVCGPPNAGKTTHVREHAQPFDVVYDFDAIADALTAGDIPLRHAAKPAHVIEAVLTVRAALLAWLCRADCAAPVAWIITSKCGEAKAFAQRLQAERVHIGPSPCAAPSAS